MTQIGYKRLAIAEGIVLVPLLVWLLINQIAVTLASHSVQAMQRWRDMALQSDTSKAAEILGWVSEDFQPSDDSRDPLAQMQTIQFTNTERDIIAYLRVKTGEDLGSDPKAWVEKYAPKR